MKTFLAYCFYVLSVLPSAFACCDNLWLQLGGFAYMGVWMYIVYNLMEAKPEEGCEDEQ